jgi:broad specificity phosphatase PhoE
VVTCALLDLRPDHFWNFDFGLASITVIELRAGRAVLRALNIEAPDLPVSEPDRRGEGAL